MFTNGHLKARERLRLSVLLKDLNLEITSTDAQVLKRECTALEEECS